MAYPFVDKKILVILKRTPKLVLQWKRSRAEYALIYTFFIQPLTLSKSIAESVLTINGDVGKLVTPVDCKSAASALLVRLQPSPPNLARSYKGHYFGLSIRLSGFDSPSSRQVNVSLV
jgi:hypothetical protein